MTPTKVSGTKASGKVYLVGAGPGDEGLITLRGVELLALADVVLYDGLINPKILQHANSQALLICVGKHGHGGTWTQREIDDETVRYALEGKRVVRLKGGDTTVFARTAEEIERLVAEGISFEVVPGITAALAVSAYTGIPLTHRDWASSVALVTGQLQPVDGDVLPEDTPDWAAIANFPGTLVIYMGMTTANVWSQMLVQNGKPSSTPVALVRRVSWDDQQIVRCTLGSVSQTLSQHRSFRPPVIAIIGEVADAPVDMDWFASRPVSGLRFLIASSETTGAKLCSLISDEGGMAVIEPATKIAPPASWEQIDTIIEDISRFDWILFASAHGVDSFLQRMWDRSLDARAFKSCQIACVGEATAISLRRWGLSSDCTPETAGIENLISLLVPECLGKSCLLVRTATGKQLGIEALEAAGASVECADVYIQQPVDKWSARRVGELMNNEYHGVLVTSQNIAIHAVRLMGDAASKQSWFCLSDSIAVALRRLGCTNVFVAANPSLVSLIDRIKECLASSPRSRV
ncbi:MAG: uroporphyrinogen-III C-methyltransferase [Pirellula sp.]|nr:uroporphyrinogen-III C-methyltransferase [Pirellula sp.]